jgi:hypothetical protein
MVGLSEQIACFSLPIAKIVQLGSSNPTSYLEKNILFLIQQKRAFLAMRESN